MSKLIEIEEGILVEVSVVEPGAEDLSYTDNAKRSLGDISKLIDSLLKPMSVSVRNAGQAMGMESATMSIGVKVGTKGSLILASGTAEANFSIKVRISCQDE